MDEPIYRFAERITYQLGAMTFHVPDRHVGRAIRSLEAHPVEHPGRPGVFSDPRAVCLLSSPGHIRLRRIKVWFGDEGPGDGTGVEPASSG